MSATTSIQWTEKSWNPVRGCSIVSPGCVNCYAMKQAHRFSGVKQLPEGGFKSGPYFELTKQTKAGPQWTGRVVTVEDALLEPLSWREPKRVFVNSMSDLFHEDVPFEFVDRVFAVMALAPRHTFQILTKRAERMLDYFTGPMGFSLTRRGRVIGVAWEMLGHRPLHKYKHEGITRRTWPLPNVWLGVSAEDQQRADERIPLLLQTPAAVRFVSAEPLLDRLDLTPWIPADWSPTLRLFKYSPVKSKPWIDWGIVGGESGPGARRCSAQWVRAIVRQFKAAQRPLFVKQIGAFVIDRNDAGFDGCEPRSWPSAIEERDAVEENVNGFREEYQGADVRVRLLDRKGGDINEWPEDLRIRQFPEVRQ